MFWLCFSHYQYRYCMWYQFPHGLHWFCPILFFESNALLIFFQLSFLSFIYFLKTRWKQICPWLVPIPSCLSLSLRVFCWHARPQLERILTELLGGVCTLLIDWNGLYSDGFSFTLFNAHVVYSVALFFYTERKLHEIFCIYSCVIHTCTHI